MLIFSYLEGNKDEQSTSNYIKLPVQMGRESGGCFKRSSGEVL